MSAPQTLDAIEDDLDALDSILAELGGDITEADAEAAIDRWLEEMGEARDAKLNGYARRIHGLETNAAAKRSEELRLAQARKRDETSADWLKRRLLGFVQRRGMAIKGKETRQLETTLFRFTETMNGGKRAITYLVAPADLPEALRVDVITLTVRAGHEEVLRAVNAFVMSDENLADAEVELAVTSRPVEEEVRAALEVGEIAREERRDREAAAALALDPDPEEVIFRYARLEPRGCRLAIR